MRYIKCMDMGLQVSGGQIVAVLFAFLFMVGGILFYYYLDKDLHIQRILCQKKKSKKKKSKILIQIPLHQILNTEEAAHLLKVSRPYLVQLLEEGKLPHLKIGNCRKIVYKDIINYKRNKMIRWTKIHELDTFFSYLSKICH